MFRHEAWLHRRRYHGVELGKRIGIHPIQNTEWKHQIQALTEDVLGGSQTAIGGLGSNDHLATVPGE